MAANTQLRRAAHAAPQWGTVVAAPPANPPGQGRAAAAQRKRDAALMARAQWGTVLGAPPPPPPPQQPQGDPRPKLQPQSKPQDQKQTKAAAAMPSDPTALSLPPSAQPRPSPPPTAPPNSRPAAAKSSVTDSMSPPVDPQPSPPPKQSLPPPTRPPASSPPTAPPNSRSMTGTPPPTPPPSRPPTPPPTPPPPPPQQSLSGAAPTTTGGGQTTATSAQPQTQVSIPKQQDRSTPYAQTFAPKDKQATTDPYAGAPPATRTARSGRQNAGGAATGVGAGARVKTSASPGRDTGTTRHRSWTRPRLGSARARLSPGVDRAADPDVRGASRRGGEPPAVVYVYMPCSAGHQRMGFHHHHCHHHGHGIAAPRVLPCAGCPACGRHH